MIPIAEFSAHDTFRPGEDPNDAKSYARFQGREYAPDLIAEQALAFVKALRCVILPNKLCITARSERKSCGQLGVSVEHRQLEAAKNTNACG